MTSSGVPVHARPKRKRRLRLLLYLLAALVILLVAGMLGASWYFSSQLLDVTHAQDYSTKVLSMSGQTIGLQRTDDTARPGIFGIEWRGGGHATITKLLSANRTKVVWQVNGSLRGLRVGGGVSLNAHVFPSPAVVHLPFRTVRFADPLGAMPAWYVRGRRKTWVLLVHGYKSERREGVRPMPTLAHFGLPMLDIAYRNDADAPQTSDHIYHLGASEWQDLEAGARYALAHGAHDLILYGYSMGGGIVETFLHRSRYAGKVRAVVLDSPALDWGSVMDYQAGKRSLPGLLTMVGKRVVAWRIGLSSLDPLNQVRSASSLKAPTLLFLAMDDGLVPTGPSQALARARPDIVTLVRVPNAGHTQSWNINPAHYNAALQRFLTRVLR